ncbi:MAG: TIM44-like domain-containing protein [Solirubrobacteraceae bacterium]
MAPIKAAEPNFDPFNFRTLARGTFIKIREAPGSQRRQAGDGLLSPSMERDLNDVIDGDVAAHRHHILALLGVIDATIVSASLEDGREKIGMRFVFGAEELERDAASDDIVSDDHLVHQWAELWQFERDPSLDPSASDERHIMSFGPDRWLFAHRGWVVTGIRRLENAVPPPSEIRPSAVA